ncbi:RNA-binding domain-containing protein [Pisolithus microcarpus]|nr:RNA-binding domain-containing protein [Pisolithus microcarpus]
MEEETRGKKAIFIGGLAEDVDETIIHEHFSPFGDIVEVQLPSATTNPAQETDVKHRGFAFVNIAKSVKSAIQPAQGNRAWYAYSFRLWESEEWLQQYAKPLAQSGGVQGRNAQREARANGDSSHAEEEPADPENQDGMEE